MISKIVEFFDLRHELRVAMEEANKERLLRLDAESRLDKQCEVAQSQHRQLSDYNREMKKLLEDRKEPQEKGSVAICIPSRLGGVKWELAETLKRGLQDYALSWFITEGVADLCLARNVTLSRALKAKTDIILWVDDDMVFEAETVLSIVEMAFASRGPVAARYVARDGSPAHAVIQGVNVAGMGLMAVPCSRVPTANGHFVYNGNEECLVWFWGEAFTDWQSDSPIWLGEDYRHCAMMGGVKLMGRAGHRKEVILWPKEEKSE